MTTDSTPRTRRATPDDVGSLVELMREFYAESNYPLDQQQAASAFVTLLTNPELGCAWIATRDGAATGYIVLTFRYTMEHGALSGHVDDLFVRATSRGQRVGTALLSRLLDECRHRNLGAVHVEVAGSSAPAVALYRSLGFEEFQDGRLFLQTRPGLARHPSVV